MNCVKFSSVDQETCNMMSARLRLLFRLRGKKFAYWIFITIFACSLIIFFGFNGGPSQVIRNNNEKFEDQLYATNSAMKYRELSYTNSSKSIVKENQTSIYVTNVMIAGATHDFFKPPNIFGVENPGELAVPVIMPTSIPPNIQELVDLGWKNHSYNMYLSNCISLERGLPDYRTDYCKKIASNYSQNLPATSVIIIFFNEGLSTLLRSVHSVINRTPEHLLTEIILVDDASEFDHLKTPLDDYVAKLKKVKIIRMKKRQGLIRARLAGTAVAKGPVLTFLDAHIECTPGWIEPLLDRIAENPSNVVCPTIDVIDTNTFAFNHEQDPKKNLIGGFTWKMFFVWHKIPEREHQRRNDPSEPLRSPSMAGGLFAIDKAYFEKLGTYDSGFDIWGAENLELSFKTWMCGGTLEILPCSVVGHLFRTKSPVKWPKGSKSIKNNFVRLVEVWVDDYAKYFYAMSGADKGDYGNISDRVQLRKDLGCKSFKWYLDNVYPELYKPGDYAAYGEIRNFGFDKNMCLDGPDKKDVPVIASACQETGGSQYWEYSRGAIARDIYCLYYEDSIVKIKLIENSKNDRQWIYNVDTKQFYHKSVNKCLAIMDSDKNKIVLSDCDKDHVNQKWNLQNLDLEKLKSIK